MYELIDLRTGCIVARCHSYAQAWHYLTRYSWLAMYE